MRNTALGVLVAAVLALAGCASPERPQVQTEAIPACEPYRGDPTAFARCRLFAGDQGADLIPEAGRTASLDTQLRCAALRTSPGHYRACVEAGQEPELAAVAPAAGPVAAVASETRSSAEADYPFAQLPKAVEHEAPIAPEPAGADDAFARLLEEVERLDRRITQEPDGTVARTAPDAERQVEVQPSPAPEPPASIARAPEPRTSPPEPTARYLPGCAENGSCYGDISSLTGRPKTVSVKGYWRNGKYVRGHYRSRPRRR